MILILAEKPSQAKDISKAFKKVVSKEGYFLCDGKWAITFAFGHLLEIDTEKIFPQGKILEFPEKFEYRFISSSHKKQFQVIKNLLKEAEALYIAVDPEREGELLARLILQHAGWNKWDRTYRFWTSKALTPEVVWEEIKAKRPIKEFDSVYWEALARQHADWLVGIPLSRVLMKKFSGVWSVGRVQTPTLALIYLREKEIENFRPEKYAVIKGLFNKREVDFEGLCLVNIQENGESEKGSIEEEEKEKENEEKEKRRFGFSLKDGERVFNVLKGEKTGRVVKVVKKEKKEPPPLLHSLTTLQKEAGKLYGMTAQKVLSIAQSLYEKHFISYPRTESQHLSEKDRTLAKEVLKKLGREDLISAVNRVGKRVFDDAKLTDHFAIIPLAKENDSLSEEEKKVYHLIWRRFVGAFYPDFVYEETKVLIDIKGYVFQVRGVRIKEKGWTVLYGERKDVVLPELREGDVVEVKSIKKEEKETKPPKRYGDAELVSKMKVLGIGTPATRASIIEGLLKRGYLMREKKSLRITEKGKELIREMIKKDLKLVKIELTAEWESVLKAIREKRQGMKGYRDFIERTKEFVRENVKELEDLKIEVNGNQSKSNQDKGAIFKKGASQTFKKKGKSFKSRARSFVKGKE